MKRRPSGGLLDRDRALRFSWDGRTLSGFAGDTLASALLGNNVSTVGRSVAQGRPRGVMSAGLEEAHAFAQIGEGGATEPLVRSTGVELYEGLVARSLSIRGVLSPETDSGRFEKRYAHADVMVVGGGPTGIAAALAAGLQGARVVIADEGPELGGALLRDRYLIDGRPAAEWVRAAGLMLAGLPEVRVLPRTTAFAALDQNGIVLAERVSQHLPIADRSGLADRRLWRVRAKQVILATGALERPLVFPDNDRPGIMLASAARAYLHRFALTPERIVVFATNDDAYRTVFDLHDAGVVIAAVLDARDEATGGLPRKARQAGFEIETGAVVTGTIGDQDGVLQAVRVARLAGGGERLVPCDLLAVSGGWDPNLNLHQQRRGATRWDDRLATFLPGAAVPMQTIVGAANGRYGLNDCLVGGREAGLAAAAALGFAGTVVPAPSAGDEAEGEHASVWHITAPDGDESRSFIDLHRDVTVAGVTRALGAGVRHVEHVKRYTLIGTGVEQGRSAKVNAGRAVAGGIGLDFAQVGVSSGRPPAEPVPFALLAARSRGALFEPVRTTPIHPAHVALGAVFEDAGQWKRARYYPRPGEGMSEAVVRECLAVRNGVALMDASTLGKIDVQGPDSAKFLDRLYTNRIGTLKPGRARYGLMCRLDGVVFDDGVVMRLEPNRFFVTTTTGNAGPVMEWMEQHLQTEWPDLRVWLTSVTEQWATVPLVGPRAREVLAPLVVGMDLSKEAFPFMAVKDGVVAGLPARVARVSFSGELAFEVSVAWDQGLALWDALLDAGSAYAITPYGTEALDVLRTEKGYIIVGQDTDATTTPADAGLEWMIAQDKDFLGKRSLERPAMQRTDRKGLVGILPDDPGVVVPEGCHLVADPNEATPMTILGHITSSFVSPSIRRSFGLAMVTGGRARVGQRLYAPMMNGAPAVTIVDPVFYDPKGARRDG